MGLFINGLSAWVQSRLDLPDGTEQKRRGLEIVGKMSRFWQFCDFQEVAKKQKKCIVPSSHYAKVHCLAQIFRNV